MDAKANSFSLASQQLDELCNGILSFGYAKTIARYDHDVLGVGYLLYRLIWVDFLVDAGDLHSLASSS